MKKDAEFKKQTESIVSMISKLREDVEVHKLRLEKISRGREAAEAKKEEA